MTGPEDSPDSRPISVAELLARSGTIGAPPPGGRRRRRRGNSEAVTVAELTGEIPVVGDEHHYAEDTDDHQYAAGEHYEADEHYAAEEHYDEDLEADLGHDEGFGEEDADDVHEEAEPYAGHRVSTNGTGYDIADTGHDVDEDSFDTAPEPHVDPYPPVARVEQRRWEHAYEPRQPSAGSGVTAEEMRPDPVDEPRADDADGHAAEESDNDLPAYLRTSHSALFGGDTHDDRGHGPVAEAPTYTTTADDLEEEPTEPPTPAQKVLRSGLIVLQSVLAVAFGAGLFIAFDELWQWNNIVALVLSVLVILGLVVAVRVVRKTEDIGSTLIAVAVGALVTLGPLALLQSG